MKILGIETATRFASVAFIDETRLVAEYRIALGMRHAERLLPLIDSMLREAHVSLSDLHAIAVSIGPGSFTGLRVGLATAKGLAIGCGLPLVPVPTLEAMALPFCHSKTVIVPVITARKDAVYWAIFSPEGVRLHPDSVSSVEKMLEIINQESVLFFGEGALLYQDKIVKDFTGISCFPPIGLQSPLASSVAQLGLTRLINKDAASAEDIVPVYLHTLSPK
ncbi:MAG: tRNA (adenosine(37)-N6)-threonylcarbamoyltransferase complex dimerization subunit type 1 TsaB [Nitrospirae bacterium]|nr:tRNA (adenosine(37)-N6)-threonylcarbamoyltransferase complex dimerization subunit type 1 TsaB [Candidatus Troglogloeales bacterium]